MSGTVYDAGMLIKIDRDDRVRVNAHRSLLSQGVVPQVPATVVAQVSRSSRQVQLRRALDSCEIVDLPASDAHELGALLGRAGTSDVVGAHVALVAARTGATILTSDPDDLRRLTGELGGSVTVVEV